MRSNICRQKYKTVVKEIVPRRCRYFSISMGAPLSESTMSTTAAQGWKSRFSGRRPSAGFHEKGKEETTTTTTTKKAITLTSTSATVVNVSEQEASVQVNGVKSDNDASTTQKSARFKKKMSGRFRHMLPGSQSTRALKDSASDDSPSNPQTPQSQGDGNPGRGNRNQDQVNVSVATHTPIATPSYIASTATEV